MMNKQLIKVKAAGMFTPQEQGPCKLTIIIPESDTEAQNYAFTKLRYQNVVIGLDTGDTEENQTPMDEDMARVMPFINAADSIMAKHGITFVPMTVKAKQVMQDEGLFKEKESKQEQIMRESFGLDAAETEPVKGQGDGYREGENE